MGNFMAEIMKSFVYTMKIYYLQPGFLVFILLSQIFKFPVSPLTWNFVPISPVLRLRNHSCNHLQKSENLLFLSQSLTLAAGSSISGFSCFGGSGSLILKGKENVL